MTHPTIRAVRRLVLVGLLAAAAGCSSDTPAPTKAATDPAAKNNRTPK